MICISYQDNDVKVHFAGEKKMLKVTVIPFMRYSGGLRH